MFLLAKVFFTEIYKLNKCLIQIISLSLHLPTENDLMALNSHLLAIEIYTHLLIINGILLFIYNQS